MTTAHYYPGQPVAIAREFLDAGEVSRVYLVLEWHADAGRGMIAPMLWPSPLVPVETVAADAILPAGMDIHAFDQTDDAATNDAIAMLLEVQQRPDGDPRLTPLSPEGRAAVAGALLFLCAPGPSADRWARRSATYAGIAAAMAAQWGG